MRIGHAKSFGCTSLRSLAQSLGLEVFRVADHSNIRYFYCVVPVLYFKRGDPMDSQFLVIVISVLVIIAIAAAAWIYAKKTKSQRLQRKFGPEYDQTIERLRNREVAEAELQQREKRVERFHIVPLSMQDSSAYQESWTAVQSRFVDDPSGAVEEANQLISEVMK